MPSTDYLIQIDLVAFTNSLEDIIKNLEKMGNRIEKNLVRLTYFAGNIIASEAKKNHAFKSRTGTLVRSIHCAPPSADHGNDKDFAEDGSGDLTNSKGKNAEFVGNFISVEIGSWLDYAYWIERGTKFAAAYPYLLPAFESKFEEANDYIVKGLAKVLEMYSDAETEGFESNDVY